MKNKHSKHVLIALFLALLYVPTLIGLVAGDRVKTENLENRVLAERPEFSLDNISAFPREYENYYADNQPFRDPLIFVRAIINKRLYNQDISQMVTFGKEDWLFYSNFKDGAPINSYRGEDLFTGLELRQIATNLTRTRDDLKKQGCDFVLFIAPNKEHIYSEYMPDRFGPPASNYAARQLVDFLRKRTDIKVVFPYEELMRFKQDIPDIPVYFSKDDHWNNVGGYIGARALMRELGYELPELDRDMIQVSEQPGVNDLALISHLPTLFPLDPNYDVSWADGAVLPEASEKKVVYMRRDSFGGYMKDYMRPWFSDLSLYDSQKRDDEQVDALHPDIYVMELLERFVYRRLWTEPLYTAPEDR